MTHARVNRPTARLNSSSSTPATGFKHNSHQSDISCYLICSFVHGDKFLSVVIIVELVDLGGDFQRFCFIHERSTLRVFYESTEIIPSVYYCIISCKLIANLKQNILYIFWAVLALLGIPAGTVISKQCSVIKT